MASDNLGPASITTTMKYDAPNPTSAHGSSIWTWIILAGAAYALFTPSGQADVAKFRTEIDSKFNLGGS